MQTTMSAQSKSTIFGHQGLYGTLVGLSMIGLAGQPVLAQPCDPLELDRIFATDWTESDFFGQSVGISGNTAVAGVMWDDDVDANAGAAYVFTGLAGQWTQQAKLVADDGGLGHEFGYSVGISGDTVLVGAHRSGNNLSGSAYIFTRDSGNTWTQQAKLLPTDDLGSYFFGHSVALDGETAVVGSAFESAVYVFVRSGTTWTQQAKLIPDDVPFNIRFGISVSIDGDTILIGANYDLDNGTRSGAVYVFVRSGTTWPQQAKLHPSDPDVFDEFGNAVSISGDTAIIGSHLDNDLGADSGSVYVFSRFDGSWAQQTKLVASDGTSGDKFGNAVSMDGEILLVGAEKDNFSAGAAYLYSNNGGIWNEESKIVASDDRPNSQFGSAVSIDQDMAIIGSSIDDHTMDPGSNAGSAYIFDLGCAANICPGDLNQDGQLNFFDITAFLNAFSQQDPIADITSDGVWDFFDISAFLALFSAGCS